MTRQAPPRLPLATTADLAAYLGVPVATIHQWRCRGIGPVGHRVGRHLRFRWQDIDEWLAQRAATK